MENRGTALSVTVVRQTAGSFQRLFHYAGRPNDEEQQVLLDQVTRFVAIDRAATRVDVVLEGACVEPGLARLADSLCALQQGPALRTS